MELSSRSSEEGLRRLGALLSGMEDLFLFFRFLPKKSRLNNPDWLNNFCKSIGIKIEIIRASTRIVHLFSIPIRNNAMRVPPVKKT
jgi:hypothetical protein